VSYLGLFVLAIQVEIAKVALVKVKELVQIATEMEMEKKRTVVMREKKGKRKDKIGRGKMAGATRIVRTGRGKEVRAEEADGIILEQIF